MSEFSLIDGFIVGIIGLSIVTGLVRGFVKELVALSIWVLAIWLGYTYCEDIGAYLKPYISSESAQLASGFVIILLVTVIVGSFFNALLSFIMKSTGLTGTDRLLGMGFGFIRGVFIVSLLILVVKMTAILPKDEFIDKSYLYTKFTPIVDWMYNLSPDFVAQMKVLENNHKVKEAVEP
jgi:membrane protein required for colicin V production